MSWDDPAPRYFPVVDVPRFHPVNQAGMQEHLHRFGYAVVEGILTPAESETARDLFWDLAESVSDGLSRRDKLTWTDRWPVAVDGGIMPWQGSGQSEFAWFVRSRPALVSVFASLWGTDELLVSFDAMCAWRPWGTDPKWKPCFHEGDGGWFHVDQCPDRDAFECAQGLVNVLGTDAAGGGGVHGHAPLPLSLRLVAGGLPWDGRLVWQGRILQAFPRSPVPPCGRRAPDPPRQPRPVGLEGGPLQLSGPRAAAQGGRVQGRSPPACEASLLRVPHAGVARGRALPQAAQGCGARRDHHDARAGEGFGDGGDAPVLPRAGTSATSEAVRAAQALGSAVAAR